MRSQMEITRRLMVLAAAIVGGIACASSCEARVGPTPVETGCPSILINRPVRATGESFADWIDCAAIEWSHKKERSWHQPIR